MYYKKNGYLYLVVNGAALRGVTGCGWGEAPEGEVMAGKSGGQIKSGLAGSLLASRGQI